MRYEIMKNKVDDIKVFKDIKAFRIYQIVLTDRIDNEKTIYQNCHLKIPTYTYEYLKEAFWQCVSLADCGDIVLLSPGSASWDQYRRCEERGGEFKELVKELKKNNEEGGVENEN